MCPNISDLIPRNKPYFGIPLDRLNMPWFDNIISPECQIYRKIYSIRRTKSPNLIVSRPVVQLSMPNPMKPDVKSRMKM